jgi:Immunoglobulin I-set domain
MVPPSFLTGLKPDLSIRDGARLELQVAVKGDPDPQVTWTKDGAAIASSEIMEVKYKNGTASVTINEVFPEDGGKYTCRATNTKGSVETSCRVTVLPMEKKPVNGTSAGAKPTAATANGTSSGGPRVIDHVKSATVKDGDAVTLTCTIGGGGGRFDVIWLHNEKEIKPSKDFEYKQSGSVYSLLIHEIFPEDAGTYTCEAFNDAGEAFSSGSLVVEVPGEDSPAPKFVRYPVSFTAERGSAASFEAEIDAPPASVRWMKDGRELREQAMKYRMTAKGPRLGLDILECSSADAGQYAVVVSSKKGEAKAAFSLNV